jgi:hypothetical protein
MSIKLDVITLAIGDLLGAIFLNSTAYYSLVCMHVPLAATPSIPSLCIRSWSIPCGQAWIEAYHEDRM